MPAASLVSPMQCRRTGCYQAYKTHSLQIRLNAARAIAVTAPRDAETCSPRCRRVCGSADSIAGALPEFRFGGNSQMRLGADPEKSESRYYVLAHLRNSLSRATLNN